MIARIVLAAVMIAVPMRLNACPGCGGATGTTLAGEFNAADLIVVGVLKNAHRNLDDPSQNHTELHVSSIVKDHPFLAGKKVLILPRYLPPDLTDPDAKTIIFAGLYPTRKDIAVAGLLGGAGLADFNTHTFDPYRGDPAGKNDELAIYMKGAMDVRDKPIVERLEYFFKHLTAQDLKVSGDAFLEFANADYKDVRAACPKLPMDVIAARLNDPNTPPDHFGLYSLMLGHSGRPADAAVLRKLLDEPKKLYTSSIDGMLIGYVLLDPGAGWNYILGIIGDAKLEFQIRYAALHVLRFFWEFRPDAVSKDKLLEAYKSMMSQTDLADMPIEDMRKWKCDRLTAEIIAMARSQPHITSTFVRRSILKYLLSVSPRSAEAAAVIEELRGKYAKGIKDAEESLQLERDISAPAK